MPPPPEAQKPPSGVGEMLKNVVTVIAERSTRAPQQSSQSEKDRIQEEKRKARKKVEELKHGIKSKTEVSKTPERDEEALRQVLGKRETRGQSKWLVGDEKEIPEDPVILRVVAEIASAPVELQNDPTWLLVKGAELRNSLRADMPGNVQHEARNILKRIYQKIADTQGVDMGNVQIRISKDPEVRKKVEFVEFAGSSLLPEAGQMPVTLTANPSSLIEDLYTGPTDSLFGSPVEDILKRAKFSLETDPDPLLHDTHKLAEWLRQIEKVGYDSGMVKDQVLEAKARLQKIIGLTQDTQEQFSFERRSRNPLAKGHEWIQGFKDGKLIDSPPDKPDTSGAIRDLSPLRKAIAEINLLGNIEHPRELNDAYVRLTNLLLEPGTNIIDADISPYLESIKKTYEAMETVRYHLTPHEIAKLRDPLLQDIEFYKRIETVLEDPNTPSRQAMNLYKEGELDAYMHAIRTAFPGEEGVKLINHFNNLKNTIFAFHDLDFYARSAAGDIKSFKQAATYFQNAYAQEAVSDPLVESMMQCYEQALKMIRDDHDGYIPEDLVSYSALTYQNYWDELAKRLFADKVKAGLIYDYKRKEGSVGGELDRQGRVFKRGKQITPDDLEFQQKRIWATMRMAKGMGLLDGRLLEIFAFSKTPGYDHPEYGTDSEKGPAFSSKAYEGVARWFNPMADWFGKYKMGDNIFKPFFATIMGGHMKNWDIMVEILRWKPTDWQKVTEHASRGDLDKFLKERYGKDRSVLLLDAMGQAFSGRFGPLSGWGEHDTTLKLTDLEREREGGSMRLFRAKDWAEVKLKHELGIEEWEKIKNTKKGKDLLDNFTQSYRTWIWVQTIMRSPTIVASEIRVPGESYFVDSYGKQKMDKRLRSVVIKEILGIDIENQVKIEATPDTKHKELMERITVLESDVMVVQQAALYGGTDGVPRDILESDFDYINGDPIKIVIDGKEVVITAETRRQQAKAYVEKVRTRILGSWAKTAKWQQELGINFATDGSMTIANRDNISDILTRMQSETSGLLTPEQIMRKQSIHMGTDDVHWRYLDYKTLGERQWARRANDLEARATAVEAMIAHLDTIRPHPNMEEICKSLEKIYNAEKNHDPRTAHQFVYQWAKATGMIYRQSIIADIPVIGRLIPMIRPVSIAQIIFGKDHGAHWSINNMYHYVSEVQQYTKLPYDPIDASGNVHEHNVHGLEADLGGNKTAAMIEMVIIAFILSYIVTAGIGLTKGIEEETKH